MRLRWEERAAVVLVAAVRDPSVHLVAYVSLADVSSRVPQGSSNVVVGASILSTMWNFAELRTAVLRMGKGNPAKSTRVVPLASAGDLTRAGARVRLVECRGKVPLFWAQVISMRITSMFSIQDSVAPQLVESERVAGAELPSAVPQVVFVQASLPEMSLGGSRDNPVTVAASQFADLIRGRDRGNAPPSGSPTPVDGGRARASSAMGAARSQLISAENLESIARMLHSSQIQQPAAQIRGPMNEQMLFSDGGGRAREVSTYSNADDRVEQLRAAAQLDEGINLVA